MAPVAGLTAFLSLFRVRRTRIEAISRCIVPAKQDSVDTIFARKQRINHPPADRPFYQPWMMQRHGKVVVCTEANTTFDHEISQVGRGMRSTSGRFYSPLVIQAVNVFDTSGPAASEGMRYTTIQMIDQRTRVFAASFPAHAWARRGTWTYYQRGVKGLADFGTAMAHDWLA